MRRLGVRGHTTWHFLARTWGCSAGGLWLLDASPAIEGRRTALAGCGATFARPAGRSSDPLEVAFVTRLLRPAGRIAPVLAVAVGFAVLLTIGGAGALCKLEFDCGIRAGRDLTDQELLDRLRQENAGSPRVMLADGFRQQVVARGFILPTDFSFLPNGDALVSEKNGLVYRITPGRPGRDLVLDLRNRVDTFDYRGLITVAVSPTFARDRRIYVLYVRRRKGAPQGATTVARFSAFELSETTGRAVREHVLLGSATAASCSSLPATVDCLPADLDHNGAQLAFGRDGTIYLATGDGGGHDTQIEPSALAAQDPNSLSGKVLHIDRDGHGLPDNPWWNGDPRANRSKVWAVGLRNPFRLSLDPRSSVPIVGDVGVQAFEEIDTAQRGSNLGWPCYEGTTQRVVYTNTPTCAALYRRPRRSLTWPLLELRHPDSKAIVGGTFAPSDFPAPYRDAYFFGDWTLGWIRYVHIAADDTKIVGEPQLFATRVPGATAFHVDRYGHYLYFLTLDAGDLRRIKVAG